MTEVTIVMCDGPTCTNQQDKPALGADKWIHLSDWSSSSSDRHRQFCSWACVNQFSDTKVTES